MGTQITLCLIALFTLAGICSGLNQSSTYVDNSSLRGNAFCSAEGDIGKSEAFCIPSYLIPGVQTSDKFSPKADPKLSLDKDGFRDSYGRLVFFRGINVASNAKLPPFLPFRDPKWWDLLSSWGYNMVRLTIFWEAIEPEPGVYDQNYLSNVDELVNEASKRGIYIVLDMHQDEYSRCLHGDGAPYWALPGDVDPHFNTGVAGRFWFLAYFLSGNVKDSFSNFFKSAYLKDHYYRSWKEVARKMGKSPYILGYDIMNEPYGGDIPNDVGQFENGYLKPFYQEAIASIREVDPDAVGFIEPSIIDLYSSKLSAFNNGHLVYAAHIYPSFSWRAWLDPSYKGTSFPALIDIQRKKAEELGMPLFIGEFGTPWAGVTADSRNRQVNTALGALEGKFIDNAYWDFSAENGSIWNGEDYSLLDDNGRPRGLEVNVRPYLRRLAGSPISQSFNPYSKDYNLTFEGNPGSAPAVIYLPEKLHYPDGFIVCISDGSVRYLKDKEELWYMPSRHGRHYINIFAINNKCFG
ncbi:MAG: cellulase family glycosylhydrolase [Methanotrichaceae archaeon]